MNISIASDIDNAEETLLNLCRSVERKTRSKELKEEYHILCNQAICALRKMRNIAETEEYLTEFSRRSVGDR